MRLGVLCVVLAGCTHEPERVGVLGSRADVTTPPGEYPGYRVVTDCPAWLDGASGGVDIGVIGTGSMEVPDVRQIGTIGGELGTVLTHITSLRTWGGFGLGCEAGVGTRVYLGDWRDVDAVIVRVGAFLRARDLALEVGIDVSGPATSDRS